MSQAVRQGAPMSALQRFAPGRLYRFRRRACPKARGPCRHQAKLGRVREHGPRRADAGSGHAECGACASDQIHAFGRCLHCRCLAQAALFRFAPRPLSWAASRTKPETASLIATLSHGIGIGGGSGGVSRRAQCRANALHPEVRSSALRACDLAEGRSRGCQDRCGPERQDRRWGPFARPVQ